MAGYEVMDATARRAELRRGALAMLIALAVQFLIGVATNLYVSVPHDHPGSGATDYFSGAFQSVVWSFSSGLPLLIVHMLIGIALLGNAIRVIVDAVRTRRTVARWLSGIGAFGVVFAGFNGASFLVYHQDFSSMLMSGGFAIAIVAYTLILGLE